MEASVVDLRYKMKDVLEALERREMVRILYHGQLKGTIIPTSSSKKAKITEHPFFGMRKGEQTNVSKEMDKLRQGRFDDI
jgi:hypothetical protein